MHLRPVLICNWYYYLKGFGDIPQDYQKAYKWFKRSEEPIAKHWMAKMQFLGLGREANKKRALKLLAANELYNSKVLREQYKEANPPTQPTSTLFKEVLAATTVAKLHGLEGLHNPPSYNRLLGDWEGEYVELDWSKNKALRVLPLSLKLTKEEGINQKIGATIQITDSIAAAQGDYSAGKLALAQFNVPIRKQYTDYPNFTHLMTHISVLEFREVPLENETLLVARLTADYPVWREMANPGFFMLRKKATVSKEALQAFDAQAEDFIKLYPNPFEDHLLINFELAETAEVTVGISNYYNTAFYQKTVFKGRKTKGNHTLEIMDLPLGSGSYLITITHNGKEETKIIVKN